MTYDDNQDERFWRDWEARGEEIEKLRDQIVDLDTRADDLSIDLEYARADLEDATERAERAERALKAVLTGILDVERGIRDFDELLSLPELKPFFEPYSSYPTPAICETKRCAREFTS